MVIISNISGTGFGVPNWDFLGSTMVTSNYIRLTSDDRSRQGAIWNKVDFFLPVGFFNLHFRYLAVLGIGRCSFHSK